MSLRRYAHLTLAGLALLAGLAVFYAAQLRFNYNFNDFYPAGDPDLDYYLGYAQRFGNDNDYLLVGLETPPGQTVFSPGFEQRLDSLTHEARRLQHVRSAASLATAANPVFEGLGVFNLPYLHPAEPGRRAADSLLVYQTPGLVGNLLSPDARAATLVLQLDPDLKKPPGDSLLADLRGHLTRLGFAEKDVHLAGKLVAQSVFVERLQWELAVFMSLAVVLVTGLLWLTFRTWWGVVLPLVVVLGAIVGGMGLMGASGVSIDLMTALLPIMMFVVGMSDSLHLLTRYVSEVGYGAGKHAALKIAVRESGFGSALSAVTTSLGFFTLTTSTIRPIHNFGLYTGYAVLLAFFLNFTLLPALLLLLRKPQLRGVRADGHSWDSILGKLFGKVVRGRRMVLAVSLVFVALAVVGTTRIHLNAAMLDDLSVHDPVRQDFFFFEQKFAGVRPFELELQPQGGRKIFDLAVLRQLEPVENYLRSRYGLRFVASPRTLVAGTRQALNGGSLTERRLPADTLEMATLARKLRLLRKRPEFAALALPDGSRGRLTGRMSDVGSSHAAALNADLRRFLRQHTDTTILKTRLTGSANLIDKNNDNLTTNMLSGIIIDVVMVALIVLVLFRSWRMMLVVLLPNLIPVLVVAGVMGFAGVPLKVSTSIIFTIAFGIAVDDTIHFVSKLRLTLGKDPNLLRAVRHTYLLAGKAVIITSLILVGGFGVLLFSSFDGTFYVGLLIGLTLLFGVVAELTMLPVLILGVFKWKPKQDLPTAESGQTALAQQAGITLPE